MRAKPKLDYSEGEPRYSDIQRLERWADEAEQEIEKLKEYAYHKKECDIVNTRAGWDADCTCGLDKALKT